MARDSTVSALRYFFLPLSQDLNINRTATSLVFSLARAEGAVEGPVVGHLLDRYGPKPIMIAAVLLMGTGYRCSPKRTVTQRF